MSYGTDATGSIKWAGMDGSNPTRLVNELRFPYGITIDLKTSKLFWTDYWQDKIESSNLEGGDRQTVVQLPADVYPIGTAVANGRIYWAEYGSKKLQSSTTDGNDLVTLYSETHGILGITLVSDLNLPHSRTNHCAEHSWAKVCVITPIASRCLT